MAADTDDMRAFLLIVRRALLLVVAYIEQRYGIERKSDLDKRGY